MALDTAFYIPSPLDGTMSDILHRDRGNRPRFRNHPGVHGLAEGVLSQTRAQLPSGTLKVASPSILERCT